MFSYFNVKESKISTISVLEQKLHLKTYTLIFIMTFCEEIKRNGETHTNCISIEVLSIIIGIKFNENIIIKHYNLFVANNIVIWANQVDFFVSALKCFNNVQSKYSIILTLPLVGWREVIPLFSKVISSISNHQIWGHMC